MPNLQESRVEQIAVDYLEGEPGPGAPWRSYRMSFKPTDGAGARAHWLVLLKSDCDEFAGELVLIGVEDIEEGIVEEITPTSGSRLSGLG